MSLHPKQEQSLSQCNRQLGAFGLFPHQKHAWDYLYQFPQKMGWKVARGQYQASAVSSSQENKENQIALTAQG